ncbi:MAG: hypothetical protein NZZ41_03910 [Candidatus Dojkabacteria bacterium]|nr:hypothetical protein [Candidatus Dojkabacteria bacterium]
MNRFQFSKILEKYKKNLLDEIDDYQKRKYEKILKQKEEVDNEIRKNLSYILHEYALKQTLNQELLERISFLTYQRKNILKRIK